MATPASATYSFSVHVANLALARIASVVHPAKSFLVHVAKLAPASFATVVCPALAFLYYVANLALGMKPKR